MSDAKGKFVWFDLMTSDVNGAKAFYGELTGWKTEKDAKSGYEMWSAQGTTVGGVMSSEGSERQLKVPPSWLGHVLVDNVDAKAKKAVELGGSIKVPPKDIPNVGRFSVLADPQGAIFSVYQSNNPEPGPDRNSDGQFSWAELNSTDWKSAWKFYSSLLGWVQTSSMEMGEGKGQYVMFGTDKENRFGGMSDVANLMKAPAHWLFYVNVPDCDDAAKRIARLKGKVMNGPMDVPDDGRVLQALDPQGAMFGLYSQKR